jgi:hypothetical protein
MKQAMLRRQDALLVHAAYMFRRCVPSRITVHKVVEKEEIRFSCFLNADSSMICVVRIVSCCARSLHQPSALTIISEVFTFAPVDG